MIIVKQTSDERVSDVDSAEEGSVPPDLPALEETPTDHQDMFLDELPPLEEIDMNHHQAWFYITDKHKYSMQHIFSVV